MAHKAMLIFAPLALSQTPAEAPGLQTMWCMVCCPFTSQFTLTPNY